MSDEQTPLVKRLRAGARAELPCLLCEEAADEIERLQGEQASLIKLMDVEDMAEVVETIENLLTDWKAARTHLTTVMAERDKLRKALERIIQAWDSDSESMHDDPADIAREALK